jgi:hypothetical protein
MKERRLEDAVDGSGDGVLGEKDIILCGIGSSSTVKVIVMDSRAFLWRCWDDGSGIRRKHLNCDICW